ncbi:hypothetical protein HHA02_30590 [Cobetia marina]|nr:hypothetical protein HHA02_30590 [Cobetia marina]
MCHHGALLIRQPLRQLADGVRERRDRFRTAGGDIIWRDTDGLDRGIRRDWRESRRHEDLQWLTRDGKDAMRR